MAKREALARMECPECGFPDAEIKLQKGGLYYRWCPDCSAQYFPRTAAASDRLLARCGGAVPVTVTEPEIPKAPEPERRSYEGQAKVYADSIAVPEPKPEKPKASGYRNPFLQILEGKP